MDGSIGGAKQRRRVERHAFHLLCLLALVSGNAASQTTMPPVEVVGTAPTHQGIELRCHSASCMGIIHSLQHMEGMYREILPDDGIPIDKNLFCQNLRQGRPPGCSYSNPPSVPGFDPGWMGNGCGDGSFASAIASELVSKSINGYNGNLDHPLPGVSFFGACQVHDYCYASGSSKHRCDQDFNAHMGNACQSSGSYMSSCHLLAGAYGKAVETFGQSAYNTAQGERACAAWAYDMRANQCPAN